MSDTTEFLFGEEKRKGATLIREKSLAALDAEKARPGNMVDGKMNEQFANGIKYGIGLGIASIAISIEEARVNETTGDILDDMLLGLRDGLAAIVITQKLTRAMANLNKETDAE